MRDKTTDTRWDYRSESRKNYGGRRKHARTGVTLEQLNAGSLMRIADATEAMATHYTALIRERDEAVSARDFWQAEAKRLTRSNRGLRAVITSLKRRKYAWRADTPAPTAPAGAGEHRE